MAAKFLKISAKCSDMCNSELIDEAGHFIKMIDGYAPSIKALGGGGDYLEFTIDAQTGQIVGWEPLGEDAL